MQLVLVLEILVFSCLSAAVLALVWLAVRRPHTGGAFWYPDHNLDETVAAMQVDPKGGITISGAAADLLGVDRGAPLTFDTVLGRISEYREEFSRALTMLLEAGQRLQLSVHLSSGKIVGVEGNAVGRNIQIVFTDQTDLQRRLISAEAELSEVKSAAQSIRLAHACGGVIAWQVDADKDLVWSDSAFKMLPERVRTHMLALSVANNQTKRMIVDPPGLAQAAFDIRCADPDRRIFVATDASKALATDQSIDRLIYTMSETFAHLRVGLMIFDAERRLSLFNPAIGDIFGDDTDWMTQRPLLRDLLDRMRAARKLPEQIDYKAWREHILTLVDAQNLAPFEEHWHLPDGRGVKVLFRPHPTGGLAMIVEDVTESLHLRRNQEAERAVRMATTDLLEEGIAVFGTDGRLRTANKAVADMWKLPTELTRAGVHVSAFLKPCIALTGDTPFWSQVEAEALQGKSGGSDQNRLALSDGRFLSARLSPMPDGSSLLVFSDVTASQQVATALRQRNELLEHTDEMRAALIDQISHQMRTPLNSISGFGQLMSEELFGALTETQREYVNGIVSCSAELLEAINHMTHLISVDAEEPTNDSEVLNSEDALMEVIRSSERPFQTQNRTVELHGDGRILTYVGRQVRLRQVVFNLLNEALPNMPDDSSAGLAMRSADGVLAITCTHRMREQDVEPGVALALVRRFVRLEDGWVDVHFDRFGLRTLHVELPLRSPALIEQSDLDEWAVSPLAKAAQSR